MPYIAGLDPGKQRDPAALGVMEQVEGPEPLAPGRTCWHYTLVGLQSFPLGTPYATIGEQRGIGELVRDRFAAPPLAGCMVGVDATGVGTAVVDVLRSLGPNCNLVAVTITGGEGYRQEGLSWHVSKRSLVSNFVGLLHSGRFKALANLPLKRAWDAQLAAFREKQRPSGSLSWEAENERDKDDLVLAVMIAAWLGERHAPWQGRAQVGRRETADFPRGTFLPGGLPKRW